MGNYREKVEYIEVSKPDFGEKQKIQIFQGGNGDFYLTVCPHNHNGGNTIRLETSGGAMTRNPRLIQATNLMYLAIAGENVTFDEIMNDFTIPKIDLLRTRLDYVQKQLRDTYNDIFPIEYGQVRTDADIYNIRDDLEKIKAELQEEIARY